MVNGGTFYILVWSATVGKKQLYKTKKSVKHKINFECVYNLIRCRLYDVMVNACECTPKLGLLLFFSTL